MAHLHSVYDTDAHFSIDPITRTIKNEGSTKNTLVQKDHNAERFTFELPKNVDGHDMSLCNLVEVHYINIDKQTKEKSVGVYVCDDFDISPNGEDVVICSWLISGNATKYEGTLQFVLRFACLTDDVVDYQWFTAIYSGINVSSGIYNGEYIAEEYADILAQWEKQLHEHGNINTLEELYCEEVESDAVTGADANYLKFKGQSLRYVSDGAVIAAVMPVEKDGQSYLRLRLCDNRTLVFNNNIPDFVDIPVSAIVEKEEATGGIILNGSEIELPSGGADDTEIDELWNAIDALNGGLVEIETLIDESGVLE